MAVTTGTFDYRGLAGQLTQAQLDGVTLRGDLVRSRNSVNSRRTTYSRNGFGDLRGSLIRVTKVQCTASESTTLTLQASTTFVVVTASLAGETSNFRIQLSGAERTLWASAASGIYVGNNTSGNSPEVEFFVFPGSTLNIEHATATTDTLFIYEYGD